MSVLIVGNFLSLSHGTYGVCEDLAARLSGAGWKVLTTSKRPYRVLRLIDMVSTVWRKRNEYSVAQVDVFSGNAFIWAEAVCWTLRLAGKPYVLTLHGGNLPDFSRRWSARVHFLLRSAAAVTTPSRYMLEQMGNYRGDFYLHPNPLNIKSYDFRLREKPRPSLLWLRAFHKIYNPSLAPKVVGLLAREFPDIQLTMAGPDKGDGSLPMMQKVATSLRVDDRITVAGRLIKSEISRFMNTGDVFINTTNIDNTPVSLLEAMACGLCVVSTNVGGVPYLLRNEHNALLVPPNDPEAMAEAIRRIFTEPGLAKHLSQNAREEAQLFDWSVVLPQWEQLLTAVAEGRKP